MAGSYADAISGIESGGRYNLLGPVTKSGDRAYGRYQVMGENIPEWTQRHLGQTLTKEQFLNNPQAQDAVFNGQFGQYVNKYGPEGAAKAWFAGEGGMNNPNAKDMLGTTVSSYGRQFTNAMGQQPDYSSFNSPPLTPGSPAPPLPDPVAIGGATGGNNAPAGILAGAAPAQSGSMGLLGNPMQLANVGMGIMGGGADEKPPQPYIAPAVRPRVDLTPLLNFLQARQSAPNPWSV